MPLRVRIHSSVVSMMRVRASLRTTFFGTPIPLPVMTLRIRESGVGSRESMFPTPDSRFPTPGSCIRLRVKRKQVVFFEAVLPSAELADHFGTAGLDHLAQLVGREKGQRR